MGTGRYVWHDDPVPWVLLPFIAIGTPEQWLQAIGSISLGDPAQLLAGAFIRKIVFDKEPSPAPHRDVEGV